MTIPQSLRITPILHGVARRVCPNQPQSSAHDSRSPEVSASG